MLALGVDALKVEITDLSPPPRTRGFCTSSDAAVVQVAAAYAFRTALPSGRLGNTCHQGLIHLLTET